MNEDNSTRQPAGRHRAPRLGRHWLLALSLLSVSVLARATGLALPSPTMSTIGVPGEYRENRFSARGTLDLRPGLSWSTTTGLTGKRFGQGLPLGSQAVDLSTGPSLKVGRAELALPLNAGRELTSMNTSSSWSGGTPQLSVALTPKDQIRLEARVNSRNEPYASRSRRTASLSWRHAFSERWALQAGLREMRDAEQGGAQQVQSESFASLSAATTGGWRWNLQGTVGEYSTRSTSGAAPTTERATSWSLSARRELSGSWWLSGTVSARQSFRPDLAAPQSSQSVGLRLQRDF